MEETADPQVKAPLLTWHQKLWCPPTKTKEAKTKTKISTYFKKSFCRVVQKIITCTCLAKDIASQQQSKKQIIQRVFPALSNIACPSLELLNVSSNWLFSLLWLNTLSGKERDPVRNRHTPHIQRKSQHFLFSFPLLSPGCFSVLPTSLPRYLQGCFLPSFTL